MTVSERSPSNFIESPPTRAAISGIYDGQEATTLIREGTISRAVQRLDICDDSFGAASLVQYSRVRNAVEDAANKRNIHVRFITEITAENLSACKQLQKFVELRHIDGVKGNFAVTDSEYYSFTALTRFALPEQAIHSAQPALVQHEQYVFQTMWGKAVPSEQKILELEEGVLAPRIEVTQDPSEIQRYFLELVNSARFEILFFFPTIEAFEREDSIGVIDALGDSLARGVNVRIVCPADRKVTSRIGNLEKNVEDSKERVERKGRIDLKKIDAPNTENTVTILVIDRRISFIIEQKDNKQKDFWKAIGLATFSTSKPSVSSHTLFFETLWRETEARMNESLAKEEEARARRQSELLQDILTHDIRNYNQVIKLSSELLEDEIRGNDKVQDIVQNMLEAINGSTQLLERAKKLGKILSEHKAYLYPVSLPNIIKSSLSIVRNAYPQKRIELNFDDRVSNPSFNSNLEVIADDLLEEVFANAFSNAVKYTESVVVEILVTAEGQSELSESTHPYIKISIADRGRGIPDELKPGVFSRYLKSAKGTGLGMSIIHALVVERYHGKVIVRDRVPGDYTKGTVLELALRYAKPTIAK